VSLRGATVVVALAAALPRLGVVLHEREAILSGLTEKSDRFAVTLVESGTLGFLPGRPSAYTQPLYAWFLSALYWALERHWLVVGGAQILVAVATALIVHRIGLLIGTPRTALAAAVIATLEPFHLWHDVHTNREVLDGLLAAAIAYAVLWTLRRRSLAGALATGLLAGVAILGNARLTVLPILLAVVVAWGLPWRRALAHGAVLVVAAAVAVTPWVVRNAVVVGCATITTDARALWKANNENTYGILARGLWIDNVPEPPNGPPWPELAADRTLAGTPTEVDECAQARYYRGLVTDFWRDHPGEKAKLAAQAMGMLWSPQFTTEVQDPDMGSAARFARSVVQPAWVIAIYVLALMGAFRARRQFLVLAVSLLAYQTAAAAIFAGTVRYRAPWDFLLVLLAAPVIVAVLDRIRRRSRREPGMA